VDDDVFLSKFQRHTRGQHVCVGTNEDTTVRVVGLLRARDNGRRKLVKAPRREELGDPLAQIFQAQSALSVARSIRERVVIMKREQNEVDHSETPNYKR
jgi:hypothetical protein